MKKNSRDRRVLYCYLTQEVDQQLGELLEQGTYASRSEAVRASIRLLHTVRMGQVKKVIIVTPSGRATLSVP